MKQVSLLLLTAGLFATACTMDDKDRCPSGYVWKADFLSCMCDIDNGYYILSDLVEIPNKILTCP